MVVVTLGLIETWRSPTTGDTYRQIPHPAVFDSLRPDFHRLSVTEMLDDLERIRTVIRDRLGAAMVVTVSPVPLHTTFTPLDVRVANTESKGRIRAAVSEFVDRHPDVHYFHSYEMVVTAERQSDYFRDDGRHVHRHAVKFIVSEFLRLFADPDAPARRRRQLVAHADREDGPDPDEGARRQAGQGGRDGQGVEGARPGLAPGRAPDEAGGRLGVRAGLASFPVLVAGAQWRETHSARLRPDGGLPVRSVRSSRRPSAHCA